VNDALSSRIDSLAIDIFTELHASKPFIPGKTPIPVTGKYFGVEEIAYAMRASGEFWLTSGPHTEKFESQIAKKVGVRHAFMVNSGSSANLVAISVLTSKKLGERRLQPGDEVITVAAGFPTTVAPIIQNGLIPVYVDIEIGTYVAKSELIEEAIGPKTKAIMMAHTLGNPFNLDLVMELAKKHNLWVIEDNCDALGGTYDGKNLGSFGDLSTLSFYPAHHITTGEGGAVLTKKPRLKPIIESFRDWGRDCWCAPGQDNTCHKRYEWKLGELPPGYDHKYTYSHLGYNLKSGDIQAAIGIAQLNRLPWFVSRRRSNFESLRNSLLDLQDDLILPSPSFKSNPSWFGFPITVKEKSPASRKEIIGHLNNANIGTRLLFGGNLIRQPGFLDTPRRIVGSLEKTDFVMMNTFWVGLWPGLSDPMMNFIGATIREALAKK
jgi:CDP-4-dehydro-6-deoxyglucose reductase, E1